MAYGADRLIGDLQALGLKTEKVEVTPGVIFAVLREFLIEDGQFKGRVIDLGLQCTADFPRSIHAAIHVKANPQLFEKGSIANVRNVQDSQLGGEFLYWSKNFNWTSERNARRLISQINKIFLDA